MFSVYPQNNEIVALTNEDRIEGKGDTNFLNVNTTDQGWQFEIIRFVKRIFIFNPMSLLQYDQSQTAVIDTILDINDRTFNLNQISEGTNTNVGNVVFVAAKPSAQAFCNLPVLTMVPATGPNGFLPDTYNTNRIARIKTYSRGYDSTGATDTKTSAFFLLDFPIYIISSGYSSVGIGNISLATNPSDVISGTIYTKTYAIDNIGRVSNVIDYNSTLPTQYTSSNTISQPNISVGTTSFGGFQSTTVNWTIYGFENAACTGNPICIYYGTLVISSSYDAMYIYSSDIHMSAIGWKFYYRNITVGDGNYRYIICNKTFQMYVDASYPGTSTGSSASPNLSVNSNIGPLIYRGIYFQNNGSRGRLNTPGIGTVRSAATMFIISYNGIHWVNFNSLPNGILSKAVIDALPAITAPPTNTISYINDCPDNGYYVNGHFIYSQSVDSIDIKIEEYHLTSPTIINTYQPINDLAVSLSPHDISIPNMPIAVTTGDWTDPTNTTLSVAVTGSVNGIVELPETISFVKGDILEIATDTKYVDKGVWSYITTYYVNDYVTENGIGYICAITNINYIPETTTSGYWTPESIINYEYDHFANISLAFEYD